LLKIKYEMELSVLRFCEQFAAIQAAAIDQWLRNPMEKDK